MQEFLTEEDCPNQNECEKDGWEYDPVRCGCVNKNTCDPFLCSAGYEKNPYNQCECIPSLLADQYYLQIKICNGPCPENEDYDESLCTCVKDCEQAIVDECSAAGLVIHPIECKCIKQEEADSIIEEVSADCPPICEEGDGWYYDPEFCHCRYGLTCEEDPVYGAGF